SGAPASLGYLPAIQGAPGRNNPTIRSGCPSGHVSPPALCGSAREQISRHDSDIRPSTDDLTMIRVTRELLERLPKTDLHVHLDGSLRPDTMIDLAREQGKTLPTWDADELRDYMHVDDARNLVDYLARFDTTLALMQTPEAMERIAYEMAVDAAIENVRYMEVRYCPALHTSEGMTLDEAVEAPLRGLLRAEKEFGIRTALIICALRHLPPEVAEEMADLAIAWKGRGVVAFDLA